MAVRPVMVLRDYIFYFLEASFDLLQSEMKGVGIPGIGRENILEKIFALPPLAEQERIVAKVNDLMKLCDQLEIQINDAKKNGEVLMESVLGEVFR